MGILGLLFSNPLVLLGVVFTAAPIVIHWLSRRNAERVGFPSLRFLRVVSERTARRRYFEEFLLMLLRMLVLAALTLLVLPEQLWRNSLIGERQVSAVLILDNSLSAGREKVFPALQAAWQNAVDTLPAGSAWQLLLNCADPTTMAKEDYSALIPHTTATAQAAQRALVPSAAAGNLGSRVAAAIENLRAETLPEIHLFTDGQKREWEMPPLESLPSLRLFVYAPRFKPENNYALNEVVLRARAPVNGETAGLHSAITNYAATRLRGNLAVFAEGKIVDQAVLNVGARSVSENDAAVTLPPGDYAEGFAQITGDDFTGDNQRFFSLPTQTNLTVALVAPEIFGAELYSPTFYLRAALAPTATFPVRPQLFTARELAATDLSAMAAVVIVEIPEFEAATLAKLRDYAARGGTVIFFPGVGITAEKWNEQFADLLPAALAPPVAYAESVRDLIAAGEREPLLAPLGARANYLLSRAEVARHFPLTTREEARAAVKLLNGQPFIAVKNYGAGNTIIWGAPPRREWTRVFIRPVFIPLLHAQIWLGKNIQSVDYECGQPLMIAAPAGAASVNATVTLPNRQTIELDFPAASVSNPAQFTGAWQTGIYKITGTIGAGAAAEKFTRHYAVNFAAAESDLTAYSEEELRAVLGAVGEVYSADNLAALEKLRAEARRDFDLKDYLALTILLLLIAEGAYSWRRARRRGATVVSL